MRTEPGTLRRKSWWRGPWPPFILMGCLVPVLVWEVFYLCGVPL